MDPQVDVTVESVNWDALSTLACGLHKVNSANWGDQLNGSYNLVRFLHLHDQVGVGQPHTVARGRAKHVGIGGAGDADH